MSRDAAGRCHYCGDAAARDADDLSHEAAEAVRGLVGTLPARVALRHRNRPACVECWLELVAGVIPKPTNGDGVVRRVGGVRGGEPSPWQENAIRDLEGVSHEDA